MARHTQTHTGVKKVTKAIVVLREKSCFLQEACWNTKELILCMFSAPCRKCKICLFRWSWAPVCWQGSLTSIFEGFLSEPAFCWRTSIIPVFVFNDNLEHFDFLFSVSTHTFWMKCAPMDPPWCTCVIKKYIFCFAQRLQKDVYCNLISCLSQSNFSFTQHSMHAGCKIRKSIWLKTWW